MFKNIFNLKIYLTNQKGLIMPGLDKKGPMGQGPMTGRRMGRCTNFGSTLKKETADNNDDQTNIPDDDFPGGFGFGRRRGGRGRGWQNRFRGGR